MINISIQQLITLWVELEDAYNGVNGFGSETAEIYAYTLQPRSPGYDQGSDKVDSIELELDASKSLYEVLVLFKSKRDCDIFIEERKLGKWLLEEKFLHRCHIRIKAK
jgi:hypothetical protein